MKLNNYSYRWIWILISAVVLQSTVAFVLPGFLTFGNKSRVDHVTEQKDTKLVNGPHKSSIEYTGPVFVIRELSDNTEDFFDGFIMDGSIQEVKKLDQELPMSSKDANGSGKSACAETDAEDPDLLGVLITHDSAAQLKFPGSLRVNVSLSVLLKVVADRIPWLLVVRREGSVRLSVRRVPNAAPDPHNHTVHAPTTEQRRHSADDPTGKQDTPNGAGNDKAGGDADGGPAGHVDRAGTTPPRRTTDRNGPSVTVRADGDAC